MPPALSSMVVGACRLLCHRLGWDRLEYGKLTDQYRCTPWITSSRCVFSRITPEFSVVLTRLRSEFLSQPVHELQNYCIERLLYGRDPYLVLYSLSCNVVANSRNPIIVS